MSFDVNLLKNHNFFFEKRDVKKEQCLVDDNVFDDLANNCKEEDLKFASVLDFQQDGTDKRCLYLVLKGNYVIHFPTKRAVKVKYYDDERRYFFGARSYKHEIFGEFYFAREHGFHNVKATCISDVGKVISIPFEEFRLLCESHPILWKKILEAEIEKLLCLRRYAESIQLVSRKSFACVASSILAICDDLDLLKEKNPKFRIFQEDFLAYISEGTGYNVLNEKMFPLEKSGAINIELFSLNNHNEIISISKDKFNKRNSDITKKEKGTRTRGRVFWEITIKDREKLEEYSKGSIKES